MAKREQPIKIIVEITDEVIDLCAFVTEVLEFEESKEDSKQTPPAE